MSATAPLHAHHKHCDALFANAEAAALKGAWDECAHSFDDFCMELARHFSTEEELLFPAFETATGMTGGPTQMMRLEHEQMRGLLEQMRLALSRRDARSFGGAAETLLVMMQQHNLKEENILYPMCDRVLGDSIDVAASLNARQDKACPNSA